MAVRYSGFLSVPQKGVAVVPATSFDLQESYHYGYQANVEISVESETPLPTGSLLSAAAAKGVIPGRQVVLQLASLTEGLVEDVLGSVVRSWPCVVQEMKPWRNDPSSRRIHCDIQMADPVTYLSDRQIWGSYRAVSLAEIVGGALTLAGGGDGKPTTSPVLPGFMAVIIEDNLRDDLYEVPYAIAAGETLGSFLLDIFGRLGVCMELWGTAAGGLRVKLKDNSTGVYTIAMQVIPETEDTGDGASADDSGEGDSQSQNTPESKISAIRGYISSIQAASGEVIRGGMLDDPVRGAFRRFGNPFGGVGMVASGPQISLEEAHRRFHYYIHHVYTNMLKVQFANRQAAFQPGRAVKTDRKVLDVDEWQVCYVYHRIRADSYNNVALLVRADAPWRLPLPAMRSPVFVPAVVNGGDDAIVHEPVLRDRMGRIPISFPFLATPLANELEILAEIDSTDDGKIRLDDFSDEEKEYWESEEGADEAKAEQKEFEDGNLDDPYPGNTDEELAELDEADGGNRVEQRQLLAERRRKVRRHHAYTLARDYEEADTDDDDYLTAMDSFETPDDEMAATFEDPEKLKKFEEWLMKIVAGTEELSTEPEKRAQQIGQISTYRAWQEAKESKRIAPERWPPRLPLGIAEPMAGALHGFVPGHRHGDSCRVAVFHPLYAEVVGFEYRGDRRINYGLAGVTAGMVVEHDGTDSWSGFVFRRVEQLEKESEPETDDFVTVSNPVDNPGYEPEESSVSADWKERYSRQSSGER